MYFLEDEEIGLRPLELRDVEGNYKNWFNDEQVCKWNAHHRYPMQKAELVDYVNNCNSADSIVLAIEDKKTKEHVGNVSIQEISYVDRSGEFAIIIGEKAYWKKGYAIRACRLIIRHAFDQIGLQRVYVGASEKNLGAQKIVENVGFKKEGVRRKAIYKNGEFLDIYEYGLLKEEWKDV